MKIIQSIIPSTQTKQRPGYRMKPRYITIHNTANTSKGANAYTHAKYLLNGAGGRTVGWHLTVDDGDTAYQHLPFSECGWHAGDGKNGTGNRESIGIEICENSDGDFEKAVKNAQIIVRDLMDMFNIPIQNVVPHKRWSGKQCPRLLLDRWDEFIAGIEGEKVEKPKVESKPVVNKPAATTAKKNDTYSVVDWMNANNMDSSYANRAKLAKQYGITNYKGTATQNKELLNKLKGGKATVSTPVKKGDQKTKSIVDYLKSIGADSSFANRKKLAAKHGIKNYTGTANQNSQLLKKVRG